MGLIFNRYPIRVKINEVRGNMIWPKWYWARWKTDRKTKESYFQIQKKNIKLSSIKYNDIEKTDKYDFIELWSPSENEFYTKQQWKDMHPENITEHKVSVEQKLMNWLAQDNKQATLRWKKMRGWDWILPVIPIVIVGVASVLMLVIFMNGFTDNANKMIARLQATAQSTQLAAANLAEGMRVMIETLKAMGIQVNETNIYNMSLKNLSYLGVG